MKNYTNILLILLILLQGAFFVYSATNENCCYECDTITTTPTGDNYTVPTPTGNSPTAPVDPPRNQTRQNQGGSGSRQSQQPQSQQPQSQQQQSQQQQSQQQQQQQQQQRRDND